MLMSRWHRLIPAAARTAILGEVSSTDSSEQAAVIRGSSAA